MGRRSKQLVLRYGSCMLHISRDAINQWETTHHAAMCLLQMNLKHTYSLVYTSAPNDSRAKCAYVWTGLRTCTAPSANGSHTVRRELKFVGFLRELKENWMHQVSFPRIECTLFASGSRKIN